MRRLTLASACRWWRRTEPVYDSLREGLHDLELVRVTYDSKVLEALLPSIAVCEKAPSSPSSSSSSSSPWGTVGTAAESGSPVRPERVIAILVDAAQDHETAIATLQRRVEALERARAAANKQQRPPLFGDDGGGASAVVALARLDMAINASYD